MSTSDSSTPEASLGPVSQWLPWHWVRVPQPLQSAAAVATGIYGLVKKAHPVCGVALGAAEERARRVGNAALYVSDSTAQVMDRKFEAIKEDMKNGYDRLEVMKQKLLNQWSRRDELSLAIMEAVAATRGAQLSLGLADSILSAMEKWTKNYQRRLISSTLRWIRRTRRSGLPKDNSTSKTSPPRKRVKFTAKPTLLEDGSELGSDESDTDERKRKVEEVASDSEASSEDPDYEPEDPESTDSLEYNSDEKEEDVVPVLSPQQEQSVAAECTLDTEE